MATARGKAGTARGLRRERVGELLLEAAETLRKAASPAGGEDVVRFTRAELRDHFLAKGLELHQAEALVHAFWRDVSPSSLEYGVFALPRQAEEFARHRDWRFTSGRLGLPDILRLLELLEDGARPESGGLTPALEEFQRRAGAAVAGLGISPF